MDAVRQADADLRTELSEESLRLAAEAAEVGTWDLDLVTDVLTWSDRTRMMFGISRDAPVSMADFYARPSSGRLRSDLGRVRLGHRSGGPRHL